jgi:ferritin-like metal-binding protein YciE
LRKTYTASGVLFAIHRQHNFQKYPVGDNFSASSLEINNEEEEMMRKDSFRQLYVDELKDLYSAETQMVKTLPKLAKTSSSAELRQAFEEHLRQTSEHVARLEQIFEMLEEKPSGRKCLGMEGLVKEGAETMQEDYDEQVMDAAIIGAAQRVEHYEIAGYGTIRAFAELLGEDEHVSLLQQTLEEEKQADEKLSQLAEQINAEAEQGEDEGTEDIESRQRSRQTVNKGGSRRAA